MDSFGMGNQNPMKVPIPRLDLRRITDAIEQPTVMPAEDGSSQNTANLALAKQPSACFHEEFMARVEEYSESWREAALKEQ